jgi:hypothetical protein
MARTKRSQTPTESPGWKSRAVPIAGAFAFVAAAAGASIGCYGTDDSSAECQTTRETFTTDVYGKVLSQTCVGCHAPGGTAYDQGAKFILQRETYPDFVSANIAAIREYAKVEVEGKPLLLRKPLGEQNHGGGAVLAANSEEYKILSNFVNQVRSGQDKTCPSGDAKLDVTYLDNQELYRKAALNLAGRVPTDAEFAAVTTDASLDAAILKLTEEEQFYERLMDMWNDVLLTEKGFDVGNVRDGFPGADVYSNDKNPAYSPDARNWANISLRQEPLRIIEFVTRNKLPFSDVVAGNYTVVNPYLAQIYGLGADALATPENFWHWQKGVGIKQTRNATENTVPLAGVLSTPSFLMRWETTPTNRSRKRARIVQKTFLATDILKFAQRPVDPSALASVQNAPLNDGQCRVCHQVNDPIAGAFRGFSERNSLPSFDATDNWHDDMAPPGFAGEKMPASEYANALNWLGRKIGSDSRFGLSVAQIMFQGITGDAPLEYPTDRQSPTFADKVKAFETQNDWFLDVARNFVSHGTDIRQVVLDIVKSPYYRAKTGTPSKPELYAEMGNGRLLTPELLSQKFTAVLGIHAGDMRGGDFYKHYGFRRNWLEEEWRLLYGGIDSKDVTKRVDTLSPGMLAAATFITNKMACRVTAYDFTKAPAERTLFKFVEPITVPFSPRTDVGIPLVAVPENETKIRQNLVHLYWRVLGERVEANSDEVNRAYNLFTNVWKGIEDNSLKLKDKGGDYGFADNECRGATDWAKVKAPADGNVYGYGFDAIPAEKQINQDKNFTIRAWQAVLTYMLSDYRFLHE